MADAPITDVVARWHAFLKGELAGGLDDLLHDDCVFWSPIVFSPQRGKELTKLYLSAAGQTFVPGASDGKTTDRADADPAGGGDEGGDGAGGAGGRAAAERGFRYVKKVLDGHHAVLEFETWMGDVAVNGVDIITCDDDGRIVEFKVMIRPLRAVNEVHARMKAMLELMGGAKP